MDGPTGGDDGPAPSSADDAIASNDGGTSSDGGANGVEVNEGITYAEREVGELGLDLFVPDRRAPPLVVYFHGGGWVAETRDNVPHPRRYAAELGYAVASVDYRLSEIPDGVDPTMAVDPDNPVPRGVFPDHFVDAKASIRWLRAHADDYGYDARRIAAWGASAGGHLAALAGVLDDVTDLAGAAYSAAELEKTVAPDASGAVQAVVDWYGVHDLTGPDHPQSPEALLIGGPRSENRARYEAASPVTHVDGSAPPFCLLHGREDDVVPVEQSRLLFDALDEHGVDAVRYELHDLNHVFASGGVESIESERVAMDLLLADPTPAQSVYTASHAAAGDTPRSLVPDAPRAGPVAIRHFLDRTIGADR